MPTAEHWIEQFAGRLGVEPPDAETVGVLLAMTGVAAHASERTAAPISAWIVGRAGLAPTEALAHAEALAAELDTQPDGSGSGLAEAPAPGGEPGGVAPE
ncbi:MAG: DUF6457 domain-containing protein [Acidimicrobiales bacterium]|jgi:hypothetical protein